MHSCDTVYVHAYMTLCASFLSCVQASSAVFVVLLFQFWYSMNDMQKKTEPQEVCVHAHTADTYVCAAYALHPCCPLLTLLSHNSLKPLHMDR